MPTFKTLPQPDGQNAIRGLEDEGLQQSQNQRKERNGEEQSLQKTPTKNVEAAKEISARDLDAGTRPGKRDKKKTQREEEEKEPQHSEKNLRGRAETRPPFDKYGKNQERREGV